MSACSRGATDSSLSLKAGSRKPRHRKSQESTSTPYIQGSLFSPGEAETVTGYAGDGRQKPDGLGDAAPYLQIQSVPVGERVDPRQPTYKLVILPYSTRAAGGQFTADEAHEIAKATKEWDWRLDGDQRPKCQPRLEALLDSIIKRSAEQGGEG
jgi:hypothetical protein